MRRIPSNKVDRGRASISAVNTVPSSGAVGAPATREKSEPMALSVCISAAAASGSPKSIQGVGFPSLSKFIFIVSLYLGEVFTL